MLDATSSGNMSWDLNIGLSSWRQETGYTGTVTIETKYPDFGAFTNLAIGGDCLIHDGTWTHPANSGNTSQADRLHMTVGGSFVLGSSALFNVTGRGYAAQRGPGAGNGTGRGGTSFSAAPGRAASHGGMGVYNTTLTTNSVTYGSVRYPSDLGSGASSRGGGAVLLDVAGEARVDGTMVANGITATTESTGGAGGTIRLVAGTVAGGGLLQANGSGSCWSGGGGRIAVILRNSDEFGPLRYQTFGGVDSAQVDASAGTVYLEGMSRGGGRGTVLVNNNNIVSSTAYYTELPPTVHSAPGELAWATLTLTNRAYVGIVSNLKMGDLFIRMNTPTTLLLLGNTLTLKSDYHDDWGDDAYVIYDGGQIIWTRPGTIFMVR